MPRNRFASLKLQAIGDIPAFLSSRRFYSEKLFVFSRLFDPSNALGRQDYGTELHKMHLANYNACM